MDPKRLNPEPVRRWTLAAAALAFLALTAFLGRPAGPHWNSPDEMANAFWAARTAAGQPLAIHDAAVGLGAGAVHPRSFAVRGDALVPGGFPGLFLLYAALNVLVELPLWSLTPLLTALAALALYGILKRRDGRWAFWSALLFLASPAVVYYAARGLFPNLLLVDLLIFALWVLTTRPSRSRWDEIVAGLLVGAALVTRLAELPWVIAGTFLWYWSIQVRRPGPAAAMEASPMANPRVRLGQLPLSAAGPSGSRPNRQLLWFIAAAALPLVLYAVFNAAVYGAPWRTGYVLTAAPAVAAVAASGSAVAPRASLLPFGFHPRLALVNAWNYFLLFWYLTLPALGGLAWWLAGWARRSHADRVLALFLVGLTAWLAAFYGSWLVEDRFNPADVTIGTSYVRYFLPVLVLATPFAAGFFLALADRLGRPRLVLTLALVLVAALSCDVAVWRGDESLRAVRRTLVANEAKSKLIDGAVPPNAIILTQRFDKLLFPERMRFVPDFSPAALARLRDLTAAGPVVYYGLDSDAVGLAEVEAAADRIGLTFLKWSSPVPGESFWSLANKPVQP